MNEIAKWIVRLEIPVLSLSYAYFVLTDNLPLIAVFSIVLIWVVRTTLIHKLSIRTPFDISILLIVVMLPVSLWVSSSWFLTLPKIYGILLSVAFFYSIVNHVLVLRDLAVAQLCLVLLCLAIAAAGLIGTDWVQGKIVSAGFIYDRLPRIIQNIPRSIAGGFARNGIGGTLTFSIPLLAALSIGYVRSARALPWPGFETARSSLGTLFNFAVNTWMPRIAIAGLALSLIALALTQSRGGLFGTLAGLLMLLVWKKPRLGFGIVAIGILALIVLVSAGQGSALANYALNIDSADGTLASRLEVWQRGWMMVQDFPFTGIGIGTYNVVAHALYPFFIAAPDEVVPHAHNQLLEVAVDLGVPGFVAYVSMLIAFVVVAVRAYRSVADQRIRLLIMGLSAGMLAHHVFGITDAFILGSKPGLLMWIYFAIIGACYLRRGSFDAIG